MTLLAGCAGNGGGTGPLAMSGPSSTVAFESVDGPPPQVFDRLVRALESESAARNMAIVSREGNASYRVRSYLSAQIRPGRRATIVWVWDVYDRDQQRALRLSGEEPAGKGGRDVWALADDALMKRIAQAGLNGVSALMNGTAPETIAPAQPVPRTPNGPAIASADATSGPASLAFNGFD